MLVINKVILIGRLTKDPEIRYLQNANNTAMGKFSIAVPRKYKKDGESDCDFLNCVTFGKQAEFVEKYLFKGTKIALSGRIENNNYKNKDGQMVYNVQIMVEEIEFAESKSNGQSGSVKTTSQESESKQMSLDDGFMNITDSIEEELPFA